MKYAIIEIDNLFGLLKKEVANSVGKPRFHNDY